MVSHDEGQSLAVEIAKHYVHTSLPELHVAQDEEFLCTFEDNLIHLRVVKHLQHIFWRHAHIVCRLCKCPSRSCNEHKDDPNIVKHGVEPSRPVFRETRLRNPPPEPDQTQPPIFGTLCVSYATVTFVSM